MRASSSIPAQPVTRSGTLADARRASDLALIIKHTHPDYLGASVAGPTVLILRNGGTTAVAIAALTDDEFAERLAFARRREARS